MFTTPARLPAVISLTKSTLAKTGLLHATLQQNNCTSSTFQVTLTFNKSQGHSNWYQTVKHRGVYQQTKFVGNWFLSI